MSIHSKCTSGVAAPDAQSLSSVERSGAVRPSLVARVHAVVVAVALAAIATMVALLPSTPSTPSTPTHAAPRLVDVEVTPTPTVPPPVQCSGAAWPC